MNGKTINNPVKASRTPSMKRKEYKPRVGSKRYKQGYQAGREDASVNSFIQGCLTGAVCLIFIQFVFF